MGSEDDNAKQAEQFSLARRVESGGGLAARPLDEALCHALRPRALEGAARKGAEQAAARLQRRKPGERGAELALVGLVADREVEGVAPLHAVADHVLDGEKPEGEVLVAGEI